LSIVKTLRLAEDVGLLGTGTERRLLARRLEAVRLEDALQGLRRRATASLATATNRGCIRVSSGGCCNRVHFVYWMRETFRLNAGKLKMEPMAIIAVIGIVATAGWLAYNCRNRSRFGKLSKSPSTENLSSLDPIPISSLG